MTRTQSSPTPVATIVDTSWRGRVISTLRVRGGEAKRDALIRGISDYHVQCQQDLPRVESDHECDCEFCDRDQNGELDWDAPEVQKAGRDAKEWVARAITELAHLGTVRIKDGTVSLVETEVAA